MQSIRSAIAFGLALTAVCAAGRAEENAMEPFVMKWRGSERAVLDLSGLLDRPAGKDGFVRIRDGHLYTARGRRLRIWGVNFTGAACYPRKADAGAVADHLARFGINCVRFHFLDSAWGKGASIFPQGADTTRRLDAAQLDRLDHFIWQLKRRGVYSNINLNVGRVYREGDGVADRERLGLAKALQYFDPHIAALHREYAAQVLTHRNPYTKTEYRREPAVVIVELVNENSIVESWFAGRLRGKHTGKHAGTWADITAHYERMLTGRFNAWLGERYPAKTLARWRAAAGVGGSAPLPRLRPEQFAKAASDRFAAEAAFYMALESAYFNDMQRHLKKLGVRAAIVATSDHNHWHSGYPLVASASKLDGVDGHVYWQHPSYGVDRRTGRRTFRIANSPMVNDPLHSTVVQLSRTPVAAKPYTVSEVNHPFPNEYACEGIPILAAYALLQDWDGIFFYTFEHSAAGDWMSHRPGHFDIRADPVKMSQLASCAAMFHRGDVAAAKRTVPRSYSRGQVIETLRMPPRSQQPLFTPGFSRAIPLVHATRVSSFDRKKQAYPPFEAGEPIVSDTGELTWRRRERKGLMTIETDRTQGLVGFVGGRRRQIRNLAVEIDNDFCAIVLTSLDGKPLASSSRMLLTAGARTATTGMRWDAKRHTLLSWGRLPLRIEPVTGVIRLRGRRRTGSLECVPLDGAAVPLAPPSPARGDKTGTLFRLDQPTVWYLLRCGRQGQP